MSVNTAKLVPIGPRVNITGKLDLTWNLVLHIKQAADTVHVAN